MDYDKVDKFAGIIDKYILLCVDNFVGRHGTVTDESMPKIKTEAKRHVERLLAGHNHYHEEINEAWQVAWEAFLLALDEIQNEGELK